MSASVDAVPGTGRTEIADDARSHLLAQRHALVAVPVGIPAVLRAVGVENNLLGGGLVVLADLGVVIALARLGLP